MSTCYRLISRIWIFDYYRDVQCGLLHCEGGSTNPLYGSAGSDRAYSETLMSINGVKYGCK